MKWNRYTIKTTTEAVDLISCMLAELGIEGIEIQDNVQLTQEEAKTMFVDFIPELPPDDGTAKVNFYIDADEDDNTILGKVEEGLEELRTFVNVGDATVTESQTEDKDWINNWKQVLAYIYNRRPLYKAYMGTCDRRDERTSGAFNRSGYSVRNRFT